MDKRNGQRVTFRNNLEAVLFAADGTPGFATELEINFGGCCVNSNSHFKPDLLINIALYFNECHTLNLQGYFLRKADEYSSVFKFKNLSADQKAKLAKIMLRKLNGIDTSIDQTAVA